MKRIALAALLFSSPAFAATAFWTGNIEYVTTVTYKQGIRCEYQIYGENFWKVFVSPVYTCPSTVEVE